MLRESFDLPVLFDLGATFAFALSGALAGIKRGYDIVGVFARLIAAVDALGSAPMRRSARRRRSPQACPHRPRFALA